MINTNGAVIKTDRLSKRYTLGKEDIEVLHKIAIELQRNDYVALMGQSGSGKSTLLNILGCLDIPTSGEYYLNGTPVSSYSPSKLADIRNREIGFVFQNFNLLPKLTVEANVELPLIYAGVSSNERRRSVREVLERFGLWERKGHKPNEISGGQKQRVAIARALVKRPSLILSDEPTGNLDSHTTAEILDVFDELSQEGNTILTITHEKDVADRAKRIIRIVDGKIVD